MRYTLILINLIILFLGVSSVRAESAGGGFGIFSSDKQLDSNLIPKIASQLSLEIPRAWITPTQALVGQSITIFAEVSGSDISEVNAYYDVGSSDLALLTKLTDGDGDKIYTGTFIIPPVQAGIYYQFRIIANNSFGNQVVWPGVTVTKAINGSEQNDFSGKYNLSDPKRTYFQYHGNAILNTDGTGRVREFISGQLINPTHPETMDNEGYLPVDWSYDSRVQSFIFDWTLHGQLSGVGRFEGIVGGNTTNFTISGHWYDGSPGQLTLQRIP